VVQLHLPQARISSPWKQQAFQNDSSCPRRIVLASADHSGDSFELAARATASIVIAHTAAP